ncbi:MAG TPA: hypothetical protein VGL77_20495, partial [Armatimonadota bacterium]
ATWDRYFVEAAMKPEYGSAIGLLAAYQDNRNYLLFRWQAKDFAAPAAPCMELIAMMDGMPRVLATAPCGFDPEQWYRLRINLTWTRVQALVDDAVVLEADNPGPVEGLVGLYADGAASPHRPKLDDLTATMYRTEDTATGRIVNDAADALRATSCMYFDDVRVGPWESTDDLMTAAYPQERTGAWTVKDDTMTAAGAGRWMTGCYYNNRYIIQTRVRLPVNGRGGLLFHLDAQHRGYAWVITPTGQQLQPINGTDWLPAVDSAATTSKPGEWVDLRVVADAAYVACYSNGVRVLEAYDPARMGGRCGIWSVTPGFTWSRIVQQPLETQLQALQVHPQFDKDKWLVTWSSAEADWYPSFTPKAYVTPAGLPHETIGPAAPLPTDQAGLYWHKGGHYHDLQVSIPLTPATCADQIVYLTSAYAPAQGYRLCLQREGARTVIQLWRQEAMIGAYPCTLSARARLLLERRGSFLLLRLQSLDPSGTQEAPEILTDSLLTAYRDPQPLPAHQIGFTVTVPQLPAAAVTVCSDRLQDTFERAPVAWTTQSGVWAVMARYACQPKWNWFGGFGAGTPTVWSKYRLDGDQTVEAYLGIKMQYDNAPEEYSQRFRDVNLTICADGAHLNTGYSLIRGGRPGKDAVTLLLRRNTVVWSSTDPAYLLPPQGTGHRQWFATRLEKEGATLRVFIDNRLATTYVDPQPLSGGYAACWTLNNGIMLGRANLSAERMTPGHPQAAAPLAVQEALQPRVTPSITWNGTPLPIATFESGLDGWTERAGGWSGRIIRERTTDPQRGSNTVLAIVNPYPAGEFAIAMSTTPRDLAALPIFHMDYRADPGSQVNLYLLRQGHWYECVLSGTPSAAPGIDALGNAEFHADGTWHHLVVDLGTQLRRALLQQTGTAPDSLLIEQMVLADWQAAPLQRTYGFGESPGGSILRVDNAVLTPRLTGPVTVAWSEPTGRPTRWRIGIDAVPQGVPTTESMDTSVSVQPAPGIRYLHLQPQEPDGRWVATLHLPLTPLIGADGETALRASEPRKPAGP